VSNKSYSELREIILDIIGPNLSQAGIQHAEFVDDTDLLVSAILDSFDYLDLISELEERSGITIDLAAMDDQNIATAKGLIDAVIAQA
jgi:acyl carrier protein